MKNLILLQVPSSFGQDIAIFNNLVIKHPLQAKSAPFMRISFNLWFNSPTQVFYTQSTSLIVP
jgi:hypothetical protein